MAIGFSDPRSGYTGVDYYRELERQRAYSDMMRAQEYELHRVAAAQQQSAYIPPQKLEAIQADNSFTANKKLLLLEN